MKNTHKIKAFTLNEMMVVLVITAIVVGLTFSILSLTQKQLFGMQQNYIKNDVLRRFEESLWIDFNKYREATYNANQEVLIFKNEISSVTYEFNETFILKNLDTIYLSFEERNFFLDGHSIDQGKIDALEFIRSLESQNSAIFIYKKKDATHYMN